MNRGQLSSERPQLSRLGEETCEKLSLETPSSLWAEDMLARLAAGTEAESAALWSPTAELGRLTPAIVIGPRSWEENTADGERTPQGVVAAALRQEPVWEHMSVEANAPREVFIPLVGEGITWGVVHLTWQTEIPGAGWDELQAFLVAAGLPYYRPEEHTDVAAQDTVALETDVSELATTHVLNLPVESAAAKADADDVFLRLHQSLSLTEVLSVAVNDGRIRLDCDRLSVAVKEGDRTVVRAMSGQEEVNPRGNHIRLLAHLTDLVLRSREALLYTGEDAYHPPPIDTALAEFLHEGRSRMLAILPLIASAPLVKYRDGSAAIRKREQEAPRVLGALIVEQVTEAAPRSSAADRELLAKHLAGAVANARAYESVFLLPVLRWIGREIDRLRGKRLAKFSAVCAGLALAVSAMFFVPWEYRVEGKGQLMPAVRHNVYAPADGEIVELLVRGGERVARDQVVLRLRNEELQMQLLNTRNEFQEKEALVHSVKAELDSATAAADRQGETRAHAKLLQARIERDGLQRQAEMLEGQLAKLTIRAPNAGVVATFRIDDLLAHRPVRRGDLLIEVMEVDGPWHLELEVPEHRLGRLVAASQANVASEGNAAGGPLVDFVLATATDRTWRARLDRIAARSSISETDGAIVEVTAALPADQVPDRRIGADVTARIHCGPSKLGYVLFGDVVEYVRRRIWW